MEGWGEIVRKVRGLFVALLLLVPVFFQCDLFQLYLYDFDEFYFTSFYLPADTAYEDMLQEIEEQAKEYQVELIYWDEAYHSAYRSEFDIYCSKEMQEIFRDEWKISQGDYKSFFTGNSSIRFHELKELPLETMEASPDSFYLVGDEEQLIDYRNSLYEKYNSRFPKLGYPGALQSAEREHLLLWLGMILIVCLTTVYQVMKEKKEWFIRMTLGTSLTSIVRRNIAGDALVMIGAVATAECCVRLMGGSSFLMSQDIWMLLLLIAVNNLVYCSLFAQNLQGGLSDTGMSRKILGISYVLKAVICFFCALSVGAAVVVIGRYVELSKMQEFYEAKKDAYYINFVTEPYDPAQVDILSLEFYRTYFDDILFHEATMLYRNDQEAAICMNANMREYLELLLPSLGDCLQQCENTVLIPEDLEVTQDEIEWFVSFCGGMSDRDSGTTQIIYYTDDIEVMTHSSDVGYLMEKNPVIMYSGRTDWTDCSDDEGEIFAEMTLPNAITSVDEANLRSFAEERGITYLLKNVYEDYLYYLQVQKRGMIINLLLVVVFILMEIFAVTAVLELEFMINRTELTVKRMLGYSIVQRIRKPLILTVISGALVLLGLFIFKTVTDYHYVGYGMMMVAGLIVFEIGYVLYKFQHLEQENITQILKGRTTRMEFVFYNGVQRQDRNENQIPDNTSLKGDKDEISNHTTLKGHKVNKKKIWLGILGVILLAALVFHIAWFGNYLIHYKPYIDKLQDPVVNEFAVMRDGEKDDYGICVFFPHYPFFDGYLQVDRTIAYRDENGDSIAFFMKIYDFDTDNPWISFEGHALYGYDEEKQDYTSSSQCFLMLDKNMNLIDSSAPEQVAAYEEYEKTIRTAYELAYKHFGILKLEE